MRLTKIALLSAILFEAVAASGQTNLPLGLPSDRILPTKLEGYKLVSLDRNKEVVFEIDGKRVTGEVPLFIYLPETDKATEMREGLEAIHSELAKLSAQREPVAPEKLMTLFLAMDGILKTPSPVRLKDDAHATRRSMANPRSTALSEAIQR